MAVEAPRRERLFLIGQRALILRAAMENSVLVSRTRILRALLRLARAAEVDDLAHGAPSVLLAERVDGHDLAGLVGRAFRRGGCGARFLGVLLAPRFGG